MTKWAEQSALVLSKLEEFSDRFTRTEDKNDERFMRLEAKVDTLIAANAVQDAVFAALRMKVSILAGVAGAIAGCIPLIIDTALRFFHK